MQCARASYNLAEQTDQRWADGAFTVA